MAKEGGKRYEGPEILEYVQKEETEQNIWSEEGTKWEKGRKECGRKEDGEERSSKEN